MPGVLLRADTQRENGCLIVEAGAEVMHLKAGERHGLLANNRR